MDSAKLNDWLQVVGLFGVIASLIFVGLQMKQDREVAVLAAYQARTDTTVEMTLAMATDPVLRSAWAKVLQGAEAPLTPDENMALFAHNSALLYGFENVYYQFQSGFLPEAHWQKTRALLKRLLSDTPLRAQIDQNTVIWREPFVELVNEINAEIDAERAAQ